MKHPSWCCQKCGEQIGWLGRLLWFIHKCKRGGEAVSANDKAAAAWDDYINQQQEEKIEELERELNAANVEIEEKRKDVVWLATEKAKLENYVMLLEEAGDAMMSEPCEYTFEQWIKAKEDKP